MTGPTRRAHGGPDGPSGSAKPVQWLAAAENLVEDERTLRAGGPALRVATLRDRTVSYGVGVRPSAAFLARCAHEGVPALRRTTGGTGLVHLPGDLVWSVVLPRSDPRAGTDFLRAYARLGRGAVDFLRRCGLKAAWSAAPALAASYCTLSARGQVLAVGERVIGGAAQHLTSSALLHQATISAELDRTLIDRLFELRPGGPSTRLTSLRELGLTAAPEELGRLLADSLAGSFGRIGAA